MNNGEAEVLNDLIRYQAETDPERSAILFDDQTVSYGEFYEEVDQAARMLVGLGMERGERLGLMFPNRPEMLILYFACFRIGVIVVPINTRYQRAEIDYALAHSACRLLIADERFFPTVAGLDRSVSSLERILVRHSAAEHRLLQAFGMTECEGFLSNRPSGPKRNGTPAEGIKLRLVDKKGNDVAPGQPGEILVQGDSVMAGYWEDPENTQDALKDGWLYGGDIATCDSPRFASAAGTPMRAIR